MEKNLQATFNGLEISPGKRTRSSKNKSVKRFKPAEENVLDTNLLETSKLVVHKEHLNTLKRLKLLYSPKCSICVDNTKKDNRIPMSPSVLTIFQNELRLNSWYEALDTCYYWLTPTQYLPGIVLRGIVEIMLNAHSDITTLYSTPHIVTRCQQILSYNFDLHPPCKTHHDINNSYIDFLTSPLDDNSQTYSNRGDFGHSAGIVKYCFNRLEDEIGSKSKDDPLYNEEYKDLEYTNKYRYRRKGTPRRLNWEQQTFEIYEMLERSERIDRLMAVLQSIIELIQIDLELIVRVRKRIGKSFLQILMKEGNLKVQIMKLFARFIHLDCPEEHIRVLSLWLNTMIQSIYINSRKLYPLTSSDITNLESEFYGIISDLPHNSIIKILEKLEPSCFKYLICRRYCVVILDDNNHNIMAVVMDFIKKSLWSKFPKGKEDFIPSAMKKNIEQNDLLNHLSNICNGGSHKSDDQSNVYPKFNNNYNKEEITQNEIIQVLYISLEALLDAYYIPQIQKISDLCIDEMLQLSLTEAAELEIQYTDIYEDKQSLIGLLQNNELPTCLECFRNILF